MAYPSKPIRPIKAAFEAKVSLWTGEAADAIHNNPERIRFLLGEALETLGLQEEIDFTLEVRRIHDYQGRLNERGKR